MRLKPLIQIIHGLYTALNIALCIGVLAMVILAINGRFYNFELFILCSIVIGYAFLVIFINRYLKKGAYPTVFVAVCNKLYLGNYLTMLYSNNADKYPTKPTSSTEAFLRDNKLATKFRLKQLRWPDPTENYLQIVLQFTNDCFIFYDERIGWPQLIDWHVNEETNDTDSEKSFSHIVFEYCDAGNNRHSNIIDLHKVNIDDVDCLLLLTHFKATYG